MTDSTGLALLRQVGADLHRGVFPVVHREGVVMPGSLRLSIGQPGDQREEVTRHGPRDAAARAGGSEAGAREGAAGHATRGASGTPGSAASVVSAAGLTAAELKDLEEAVAEYRQLVLCAAPPGAWLHGSVRPIAGLPDVALLHLCYPRSLALPIRGWAWWEPGIWVGPRHTNYGDGSICSYEAADRTWGRGKPLVQLLDLVSCWLARHLHLRYFDWWPGPQILHSSFERVRDQRPGELCGCGSLRLYAECHQAFDGRVRTFDAWREFRAHFPNPTRRPPSSFMEMMAAASTPPPAPLIRWPPG